MGEGVAHVRWMDFGVFISPFFPFILYSTMESGPRVGPYFNFSS